MFIEADTIDDLLMRTFKHLKQHPVSMNNLNGEISYEDIGILLKLNNPRSRLSITETKGKVFSAIGELCWYLAGSNELNFIEPYIKKYKDYALEDGTINGAYGPRLFAMHGKYNQIDNVIALLKERPNSRKAVIQMYDASDLGENHREFPCTCNLQFFIRNNSLHMHTHMRSNDAFLGLSHDIFTFTMLQEIISKSLNVELGKYTHSVSSLHIYKDHVENLEHYINEGWQTSQRIEMPCMPDEDPWDSIEKFKASESNIRSGETSDINSLDLNCYWTDLLRLIQIFFLPRDNKKNEMLRLSEELSAPVYKYFIRQKLETMK